MRCYRTSAWWEDISGEERAPTSMTVIEEDRFPRWSGLYDASGNKLMVFEEQNPIGFVHFRTK